VSLAENYDLAETVAKPAAPASPGGTGNILRLALNGGRPRTSARAAPQPTPPDIAAAVDILDKASHALGALQTRCAELEQELAAERQRLTVELQAARDQAREWERRATSIKVQLYDSESLLTEAEVRADAAARRAEAAEARSAAAERRAAETADQLRLYHDKIVGILGAKV
jgi:hypothetical protein